ncbi:hypothetical protein TNCV_2339491 [Trichonephila clavipes]|nr:hypothetical protein TNCV_2339491 [Trichonephila clavipes]
MKSLVYETPVSSVEDLIAQISMGAGGYEICQESSRTVVSQINEDLLDLLQSAALPPGSALFDSQKKLDGYYGGRQTSRTKEEEHRGPLKDRVLQSAKHTLE